MSELDDEALLRRATAAAEQRFPGARLEGLRELQGGVSSLTFASRLQRDAGALEVVLKVAPPGLTPVRNRDVLRQARILDLLADLPGVPVPAVVFRDPGDPPEVPPLFAMELAAGDSYEPLLDVAARPPEAAVAAERMRVAARALGHLHTPEPGAMRLADEPVSTVAEESARWMRLFETVDTGVAAGHEDLAHRLQQRIPADGPARVLHGDYRLANMLFDGSSLSAIIDWEIWSVGDPRPDLAWLLMHTAPAQVFHPDRPAADRAAGEQVPDAEVLTAEYADARRAAGASEGEVAGATADLAWFLALCYYKTASTIAVIDKRERRLPEPDPKILTAAGRLDRVVDAGHQALDRWE